MEIVDLKPPYFAVIFTSIRKNIDKEYKDFSQKLTDLVKEEDGFLGVESLANNDFSITISYWKSLEDIEKWKQNTLHKSAKDNSFKWYESYSIKICEVKSSKFEKIKL